MAEININEVREKVMNTIGNMADKTRDFAEKAADKARSMARIAKLTVEINGEKDMIKKAYVEIGKLYYDTHKDDPDGFFVQLCDEITLATESIAEKQAEIESLKSNECEGSDKNDIEVEFESVVDDACTCEVVEDVVDKAKDVVENVEDAVEETVENVVDKVEDTVEKVEEAFEDSNDKCEL